MRAFALVLLLAGCTEHTDLLAVDGGSADGCTDPGPFIQLDNQSACSGALAAGLMRYAICSCSPLVLNRGLFTEGGGPKPMPGMMMPPQPSAAVGTDGYLQVSGPTQVAGSLEAAGFDGMSFSRTSAVLGNLRAGGTIASNQFLSIDGDAYAAGDVLGRVDIGGVLHLDEGANVSFSVNAGGFVREPIKVAPPCNCGAGAPVDLAGQVMAHATLNDNARIQLAAGAFASPGGPTVLELPCGEFYLSALRMLPDAELDLRVHGHTALFIGGDVSLGAGLRVVLDPGAELDLVVGGNLSALTGFVGSASAASVRLWLASTTVKIGGGVNLSALVYAPYAVLIGDGDLTATGALFVNGLSVDGDVSVHYDAQVLRGGVACGGLAQDPVQ